GRATQPRPRRRAGPRRRRARGRLVAVVRSAPVQGGVTGAHRTSATRSARHPPPAIRHTRPATRRSPLAACHPPLAARPRRGRAPPALTPCPGGTLTVEAGFGGVAWGGEPVGGADATAPPPLCRAMRPVRGHRLRAGGRCAAARPGSVRGRGCRRR